MAKYQAIAQLVDGQDKQWLVSLLQKEDSAVAASQFVHRVFCSTEVDSYKVPIAIATDLLKGMSVEEALAKPYEYTMEMFYYCNPDVVPNTPNWQVITLNNLDKFLDQMKVKEVKDNHV